MDTDTNLSLGEAMSQQYSNTAYSFGQSPLTKIFPPPIVSSRSPLTSDKYFIGQIWINSSTNAVYVETSIVNNLATWKQVTTSGGAGTFASLTVTPGPVSLTGTTNINTTGAAVTTLGTGGTGAVNIGNATGNTAVTGTFTTSAGITVTTGGVTVSAGNVVLSNPGNFVSLPGPVDILSGAGAPAGALALHIGDMYINTTAASATTRLYIATAIGTFTNITCAA